MPAGATRASHTRGISEPGSPARQPGWGGRAGVRPREKVRKDDGAFGMKYIWLIPLLPLAGAAINGLIGIRSFSRRVAGVVACTMMLGALGLSLLAFWQLLALPDDARAYDVVLGPWIPNIPLATRTGIGLFYVPWGFRLDPLDHFGASALARPVVAGISPPDACDVLVPGEPSMWTAVT